MTGKGLTCYQCTDLESETCSVTKKVYGDYGEPAGDIGCWKSGTAINGNSTWVQIWDIDRSCWVGPDQLDPQRWHGELIVLELESGVFDANSDRFAGWEVRGRCVRAVICEGTSKEREGNG